MENKIIFAIIGVIVVLLLGLGGLIFLQTLPAEDPVVTIDPDDLGTFEPLPEDFTEGSGAAVDSQARIEIIGLRDQLIGMAERVEGLEDMIKDLEREIEDMNAAPVAPTGQASGPINVGPNEIANAYAQVVLIANRRAVNADLRIASPSYLTSVFGLPRADLSDNCQPMTNARLKDKLRLESVGPIRVQMLEPAVESLTRVFERIKEADPDLYEGISTAGSLCVRRIRGSTRVSTHAFGLSLDLNIDGKLDTLGDGRTQLGLTILADFFRDEGWFWGASFGREDSMHFEVSRDLVEQWIEEGKL